MEPITPITVYKISRESDLLPELPGPKEQIEEYVSDVPQTNLPIRVRVRGESAIRVRDVVGFIYNKLEHSNDFEDLLKVSKRDSKLNKKIIKLLKQCLKKEINNLTFKRELMNSLEESVESVRVSDDAMLEIIHALSQIKDPTELTKMHALEELPNFYSLTTLGALQKFMSAIAEDKSPKEVQEIKTKIKNILKNAILLFEKFKKLEPTKSVYHEESELKNMSIEMTVESQEFEDVFASALSMQEKCQKTLDMLRFSSSPVSYDF